MDDLPAFVQSWLQLAIVVIEYLVGGANDGSGGVASPWRRRASSFAGNAVMARVAVGHADHVHDVARGPIQGGRAAGGVVRVVGMSADDEQA